MSVSHTIIRVPVVLLLLDRPWLWCVELIVGDFLELDHVD